LVEVMVADPGLLIALARVEILQALLAKRAGELPAIRPFTDRPVAYGYYLAGPVIDGALRLAGELPDR